MSSTFGTNSWVAIVDDDESICRALARLLRAHGIEARTFSSPRDYLGRAQGTPACLCVDLHLRDEMNGFDFVEHLRVQGVSPLVIYMTGQDERELGPMMRDGQAGIVLRKPVDAQRLLDLVVEGVRADVSKGAT